MHPVAVLVAAELAALLLYLSLEGSEEAQSKLSAVLERAILANTFAMSVVWIYRLRKGTLPHP